MKTIDSYEKYMFLGGGVMAERLYKQLETDKRHLVGVMDLLMPEKRVKKEFRQFQIKSLSECEQELKNGEVALVVAINGFDSVSVIEQCLNCCCVEEEDIYVANPYTTLRPCVWNEEFEAEKKIPLHDSRYKEVAALWKDDMSIKIWNLLMKSKTFEGLSDTYEIVPYAQLKDMYWCSEDYWQTYEFPQKDLKEATVLDCGAYIGDSILSVCEKIPQKEIDYYAFEPDKENAMQIRKATAFKKACRKLEVMEYGVGNRECKLFFEFPSSGQKDGGRFVEHESESNETALQICCLDNLDLDIRGQLYIKMDIEGFELAALEGAKELIKKWKPYLAICVYHRKNDIPDIPLYIKSLVPEYCFYLRGGFHTILWAIPKEKEE